MQQLSLSIRRFSLILFICAIIVGWAVVSVNAEGARIWLDPPSLSLAPGDVKAVDIRVENVTGLAGAEVHLTFDPALLEVVDAEPSVDGVQIAHGDFLSPDFVVQNAADETAGTVDYAIACMALDKAASGNGVLAQITFRGVAKGKSTIAIQGVLLADKDGHPIEVETDPGRAVVGAGSSVIMFAILGVGGLVVLVAAAVIVRNIAQSRQQKGGSI
jgi:hypothetical protein